MWSFRTLNPDWARFNLQSQSVNSWWPKLHQLRTFLKHRANFYANVRSHTKWRSSWSASDTVYSNSFQCELIPSFDLFSKFAHLRKTRRWLMGANARVEVIYHCKGMFDVNLNEERAHVLIPSCRRSCRKALLESCISPQSPWEEILPFLMYPCVKP